MLCGTCRCRLPADVLGNFTDSWDVPPESQVLVNQYIPRKEDGKYSNCDIYTTPKISTNHTPEVQQCDSWVYDSSEMTTTTITRVKCSLFYTVVTRLGSHVEL